MCVVPSFAFDFMSLLLVHCVRHSAGEGETLAMAEPGLNPPFRAVRVASAVF